MPAAAPVVPALPRRRLATPADLPAVHALYMHPAVVPFLGYDPMPIGEFTTAIYAELLAAQSFYLFPHAGRLAGFYRLQRLTGRSRHVVQLCTLAVDPEFRGRHVARDMVLEALSLLRVDGGVRRVELTVEADNPRAIAFYLRLGFSLEGTLRGFYRRAGEAHDIDDHLMALRL